MGAAILIISSIKLKKKQHKSNSFQHSDCWLLGLLEEGLWGISVKIYWEAYYCKLAVTNFGDSTFWNKEENSLEQQILAFLLSTLKCWLQTRKAILGAVVVIAEQCFSPWRRAIELGPGPCSLLGRRKSGRDWWGWGGCPVVFLPSSSWRLSELFTEQCITTTAWCFRRSGCQIAKSSRLEIAGCSWDARWWDTQHSHPTITAELAVLSSQSCSSR